MIGWVIALVVVAGLATAGGVGWSRLMAEHREARSLPLDAVDFSKLQDGTYHGAYEGGMYKWRANECQVTVSSGKVNTIQLLTTHNGSNIQNGLSRLSPFQDRK